MEFECSNHTGVRNRLNEPNRGMNYDRTLAWVWERT